MKKYLILLVFVFCSCHKYKVGHVVYILPDSTEGIISSHNPGVGRYSYKVRYRDFTGVYRTENIDEEQLIRKY